MKIALSQLNFNVGDFDGNRRKIIADITRARRAGAALVVFSELAVTGYYPHDLLERHEFIDKAMESVEAIARSCTGIAAVVGAPAINAGNRGKNLYNAAYFLNDGAIEAVIHKSLLPGYDIFDEYRHFEPDNVFSIVEYKGFRLALTICEDIWDEQPVTNVSGREKLYQTSPMEELSKLKPDLAINISASPFSHDQANRRKNVLVLNVCKYNIPLVYVNQVGAQTELIFDGGSCVVGKGGTIIAKLARFREDFLVVDSAALCSESVYTAECGAAGFPPGGNSCQEGRFRAAVAGHDSRLSTGAVIPWEQYPTAEADSDRMEEIYQALTLGIKDYFGKMNFSDAILGLSGGLDSAVVCTLAVSALGAGHVQGLLMPSKYSSDHSIADAVALAENLGIRYNIIGIQQMTDEFEKALRPVFGNLAPDVTEENIQARTRGILLMAMANKYGKILLNTSNKSECAVGYGTLYGDMNGGLAVIADLYKTDVYRLAHRINRNGEIIPVNTMLKPPSAELRPDQKDTDSLPSYDILDPILYRYIEMNESPEEIVAHGFEKATVEKIIRMVSRSEHKRYQAPPALRVSLKAFGSGRKVPVVKA